MAYEQSMQRILLESPERRSLALAALSWIYHARRPLTISELLQALAINPAARRLSEEDRVSSNLVLDVCAGLVVLDRRSSVARFVHYSIFEYFHQESAHRRWFPSATQDIARVILAYLISENFVCNGFAVNATVESHPFLNYAAHFWGHHVEEGYHEGWDKMACEFLEEQPRAQLVARILDGDSESRLRPRRPAPMYPCSDLSVLLAARAGALETLKMLVRRGHSLACRDASGRTALHWAARGSFHQTLTLILQEVDVDAITPDGLTALHWAAKHGHVQVVVDLIRYGADPGRSAADGRTALHWAASRGHEPVVRVLLADDRVDSSCLSMNAWTALHWAACCGNPLLVVCGLDSREEASKQLFTTAKSPARERLPCVGTGTQGAKGYEETVILLLEAGVSPDFLTKRGRTAMHWAAASGCSSLVQLLRDRGAALSTTDVEGKGPWHFAVENGATSVITLLCPVA